MTISDLYLKGQTKKEILVHTYTCHPSMAINELSGPLVTAFLAKEISKMKNRYFSYRFVFAPETIGSITYLNLKGNYLKKNLIAGYICTCVGAKKTITYKKSKSGNTIGDFAAINTIKKIKNKKKIFLDFSPSGSDERQYCSLGYNLPVGSIMGIPYGRYPEYHTSLDNKKIINFKALHDTIEIYKKIFSCIENKFRNKKFNTYKKPSVQKIINTNTLLKKRLIYPINLIKKGEPHLFKYGIHYDINRHAMADKITLATKWLVHYSDGNHSINQIAKLSNIKFSILKTSLNLLCKRGIFKKKII